MYLSKDWIIKTLVYKDLTIGKYCISYLKNGIAANLPTFKSLVTPEIKIYDDKKTQ